MFDMLFGTPAYIALLLALCCYGKAFYKDCVALLTRNSFLQDTELKSKIADVFLKFYFVTRCYNQTIEDLVTNIKEGKVPVPDVIIMNSCLWDVSSLLPPETCCLEQVSSLSPLNTALGGGLVGNHLGTIPQYFWLGFESLPHHWPYRLNELGIVHMPIDAGDTINSPLLQQTRVDFLKHTLRFEVMEANLYARDVVATYGYDIVDLHYYLSMQLERRANDGIHWLAVAVRFMTNILLTHIALSWDHPLPGNITCSLLDDVVNMTDKSSVADIELPQVPLALGSDESTTYTKTAGVNKQVQTPVRKSSNKKSKKRKAKRNASPKLKVQEIQQPNINPWVQNSFLRNPSAYVNEYLNGVNSYVQSFKVSLRNSSVSGYLNDVSKNYQFGNIAPIDYTGNCLRRFFELFDTVTEFLDTSDPVLSENLKQRKLELAYLTDIFEKMNEVNIRLQGNKMNLIKAKGIISSFIAKFDIHKVNIGRKELIQFPTLKKCSVSANGTPELPEDKILIFTDHLDQLKTDMELRFEDLTKLQIPDWILDPFSFEAVDKLDNSLQTEFLDLKYDCEAKIIFKQSGYELGWVKIMDTYPQLWGKTEPLLISFPSTYLVEKGFSSVVQLLTKQRNELYICLKGDLRLNLTNIKPDIQALTEIHQAQGSH
uniref:Uncharacterized protein n=1 Tax=Timema monikensis TaxID=170555 RepID=A0A7R9HPH4_9NEOP|nr:unnamed protein product [Timema monikensis]